MTVPESGPVTTANESSGPGPEPPASPGTPPTLAALGASALGLPLRGVDSLALVAAIALADAFLYRELGGAGYALAVAAWTLLFWVTARTNRLHPAVVLALALNLLMAAGCAWNAGFWNAVAPWALLAALAVITRSRHAHTLDAILVGAFSAILGPVRLVGHAVQAASGFNRHKGHLARGILRYAIPAAAAAAILLVFGWIFSRANPVVSYWVGWFFERIWEIVKEILPDLPRLLLWGFAGSIAAGLLRPFLADIPFFAKEAQDDPVPPTPLVEMGALTAAFSLGAAVLVFLLFNALDAVYLWGKAALPAGITYSEYARRGAGWLTFALLLSTLLVGAASAQQFRGDRRFRILLALSWTWLALDAVLALGALRRIHLYVGYNGLTPLRMTGIFGILIVSAGLAAMGAKLAFARNMPWIVRRYVVIFLAGVSVYSVVPEELLAATWNTRVALAGNPAPLVWLFEEHTWDGRRRVDAEGVPALLPLLDHPDPIVARGVAVYLAEERERWEAHGRNRGWRGWQGSVSSARSALASVAPRLDAARSDTESLTAFREYVARFR